MAGQVQGRRCQRYSDGGLVHRPRVVEPRALRCQRPRRRLVSFQKRETACGGAGPLQRSRGSLCRVIFSVVKNSQTAHTLLPGMCVETTPRTPPPPPPPPPPSCRFLGSGSGAATLFLCTPSASVVGAAAGAEDGGFCVGGEAAVFVTVWEGGWLVLAPWFL